MRQRIAGSLLRRLAGQSPRAVARWMAAAAEAGFVPAQIAFGQFLLDGHGTSRDPRRAFTWFSRAAATGDPDGSNMVGRCYEQGWGVETCPDRAMHAFEAAARGGHEWGRVNLAQSLMRRGGVDDRPRCFALFKAVAEGGSGKARLKAMNSLARFLEEGWAGPADPGAALGWYKRAAALGDHWAQFNLATILYGAGDGAAADELLHRAIIAADNGFRRRVAPILLARPDLALRRRGLDALALVAAGGNPADLHAYAVALADGQAAPPEPAKALALVRAAARLGRRSTTRGWSTLVRRHFGTWIARTRASRSTP